MHVCAFQIHKRRRVALQPKIPIARLPQHSYFWGVGRPGKPNNRLQQMKNGGGRVSSLRLKMQRHGLSSALDKLDKEERRKRRRQASHKRLKYLQNKTIQRTQHKTGFRVVDLRSRGQQVASSLQPAATHLLPPGFKKATRTRQNKCMGKLALLCSFLCAGTSEFQGMVCRAVFSCAFGTPAHKSFLVELGA